MRLQAKKADGDRSARPAYLDTNRMRLKNVPLKCSVPMLPFWNQESLLADGFSLRILLACRLVCRVNEVAS